MKKIDWNRAFPSEELSDLQAKLELLNKQDAFFRDALTWAPEHVVAAPLVNSLKLTNEIHTRLDAIGRAKTAIKTQIAEILLEVADEK